MKNKSKRIMGKLVAIPIFTTFFFTSFGQSPFPIRWETKAVQTGNETFEIHLKCDIDKGWYLYEPNRLDVCMRSPLISFEEPLGWKRLDTLCVLSATKKDTIRRGSFRGVDKVCLIPYYEGSVTFMMPVMKTTASWQIPRVKGRILYHAINKYSLDTPVEVEFSLPLISQAILDGNIVIVKKKRRKTRYTCKRTVKFCPGFPARDSIKPL